MVAAIDGERASSAVIALVALCLVTGLLLESASVNPDAGRTAASVAGGVYVCYAVGATAYLLGRDRPGTGA